VARRPHSSGGSQTGKSIAFRADASSSLGAGHVMRCLTLADAFRDRGYECRFFCRAEPGHLGELIAGRGHRVALLPAIDEGSNAPANIEAPADAAAVIAALDGVRPRWIVVDHYAIALEWEARMAQHCDRLMVIDDLADRPHSCDLLLDQTYGRETAEYRSYVDGRTRLLCGARYALLRAEFVARREQALRRRGGKAPARQILVSLGGGDNDAVLRRILALLPEASLPAGCKIKVVTGWQSSLASSAAAEFQAGDLSVEFLQGTDSMASLMVESDIAIGAAGSSSWERCCLGLPTAMVVLADNQRLIAGNLERAGAALSMSPDDLDARLPGALTTLAENHATRSAMALRAAAIVDGGGVSRVIESVEAYGA